MQTLASHDGIALPDHSARLQSQYSHFDGAPRYWCGDGEQDEAEVGAAKGPPDGVEVGVHVQRELRRVPKAGVHALGDGAAHAG